MGVVIQVCIAACLAVCLFEGVQAKAKDFESKQRVNVRKIHHLRMTNKTFAELHEKTFISESRVRRAAFQCPKLAPSPTVPTSVHKLRPSDVKVVAALGDSLTAGRGADGGVLGLLIDYRGLSWSAGGDKTYADFPSLPNILRNYNPTLYGYSTGTGNSHSGFNVAKSGAKAGDIHAQAVDLVARLTSDKHVDFTHDWKVVTIFIGANDLCDWCHDEPKYSAAHYKAHLQSTLDYLHAHLPRTFVNLVEVLNVEFVSKLAQNLLCQAVHAMVCDCASNPKSQHDEAKLIQLRKEYQHVTEELVHSGKYDTHDDFTVVLQPFFRNTSLPTKPSREVDLSYFASDCFHLSKKGQVAAAEGVWNNMVEKVGAKRSSWTPGEPIECPTETAPYLYTAKNSNTHG